MIVVCDVCAKTWREPCELCRDHFIQYHLDQTGHQAVVRQPEDINDPEIPWWLVSESRRRRRTRTQS